MSFVPLAQREHFVYRIFDDAGDLLYVGATCDLENRLSKHARHPGGATAARHVGQAGGLAERMAFWFAQSFPNRRAALAAERAAIATEHPALNVRFVEMTA